jgi:ABC-type transport system involved in multi-copper enzyme maturation permease subunit
MPKMLEGDIKRFCASKRVWIAIIVLTVGYALFYSAVFFFIYHALDVDVKEITIDSNIGIFAEVVSVFTAGFAAIFTAGDFTDGTIKNRLAVGNKRSSIFLSACIFSAIVSAAVQLLDALVLIIISLIIPGGFSMPLEIFLVNLSVYIYSGCALAVFFTAMVFIFGGTKAAYIVPAITALAFKVTSTLLLNYLYPPDGVSGLSDLKIKAYTMIDRFVPFMYLQGTPRWDGISYATGIGVLTLISLAVGLIVFDRRELS